MGSSRASGRTILTHEHHVIKQGGHDEQGSKKSVEVQRGKTKYTQQELYQ
jgi:hypothetical protein